MRRTNAKFPTIWNKICSTKEPFYSKNNVLWERFFEQFTDFFWQQTVSRCMISKRYAFCYTSVLNRIYTLLCNTYYMNPVIGSIMFDNVLLNPPFSGVFGH